MDLGIIASFAITLFTHKSPIGVLQFHHTLKTGDAVCSRRHRFCLRSTVRKIPAGTVRTSGRELGSIARHFLLHFPHSACCMQVGRSTYNTIFILWLYPAHRIGAESVILTYQARGTLKNNEIPSPSESASSQHG